MGVAFMQGPYTLVAAGRNIPIKLWDQRRGLTSVAEIVTPGRVPLQVSVCVCLCVYVCVCM
jgi:hypothetical protein